ncbi:hypothetical protein MCOR25_003066 [Pyricularia grisea]|uniref:Uncharacterized protein n=1 Tax=Pyricularia grisea TaxID=148305 RepID=A0A6P8BB10_PYRGI|nr:uncharacterized protein PgNI_04393 [Pyricularia grisea]KAI6374802.1 hypothetical protein MCOR25_003066 [Pyricularia grisea]TLD12978.1 hypothetical protein PgNI_04393 [Pyricularia grisea]
MTEHDAGHQDTHSRQAQLQGLLNSHSTPHNNSDAPGLGITDTSHTKHPAANNHVRIRHPPAAEASSTATSAPSTSSTTTTNDNSMLTYQTSRNPSAGQASPVLERQQHNATTTSAAKANTRGSGVSRSRTHKNRSSSAFLLSGPLFDGTPSEPAARDGSLWQRQGLSPAAHTLSRPMSNLATSSAVDKVSEQSQTSSVQPSVRVPTSKQSLLKSEDTLRQRPTAASQRLDTTTMSRAPGSSSSTGIATQGEAVNYEDQANNYIEAGLAGLPPGTASSKSSSSSARRSLDLDSTHIVNMALSLSESRRLAARRNSSQPIPPSLAPMPDSSLSGGLRQHLQQQRRSSRNMSPRASRLVSSASAGPAGQQNRVTSPLHASFDLGGDASGFRYHFSPSTLARVQKAKDHLELLAQYRRVLDLVPPLKPTDPPGTSSNSGSGAPAYMENEFMVRLGREYNPLQYIRNRKVRARERKAIDGDAQGFGDVKNVTEWVGHISSLAATRGSGNAVLPTFEPAEKVISQDHVNTSATGATTNGAMASSKPKRPRVDWFTNPADLLADIYWLEQGDNKKYVEDRNYKRVFPQAHGRHRAWSYWKDNSLSSPTPGGAIYAAIAAASATASSAAAPAPTTTMKDTIEQGRSSTSSDHRKSSEEVSRYRQHIPSGAREKLQKLRGLHHRHSTSVHASAHELLRFRRGSVSDESESEAGSRKKRMVRSQTITASHRDALEKHMLEMIAQENRKSLEQQVTASNSSGANVKPSMPVSSPTALSTPERVKTNSAGTSRPQSRFNSKDNLIKDLQSASESSQRGRTSHRFQPQLPSGPTSPASPGQGRDSLDVPSFWAPRQRRPSIDYDSSRPTSPDMRGVRGTEGASGFVLPPIGKDLSPNHSRSGSPSRNPFSRVKQKLQRERSRSRVRGAPDAATPGATLDDLPLGSVSPGLIESPPRILVPPEKLKPSPSPKETYGLPPRKVTSRTDTSNTKSQKSHMGEIKREDSGLRGFFSKGPPRIDSVLRSGVSKVGDLLWRKESSMEETSLSPRKSELEKTGADVASSDSEASDTDVTSDRKRGHRRDESRNSTIELGSPKALHRQTTSDQENKHLWPDALDRTELHSPGGVMLSPDLGSPLSHPISRRSSRFELLKPPKLDVQAATPTSPSVSPVFPIQELGKQTKTKDDLHAPEGGSDNSAAKWPPRETLLTKRQGIDQREVLRQRVRVLRTGIMASEISSRSLKDKKDSIPSDGHAGTGLMLQQHYPYPLSSLAAKHRDEALAAADAMRQLAQQWHQQSEVFATRTTPSLMSRIDALRYQVAVDLSSLVRTGADEADHMGRDLGDGQRLQVKRAVDIIEKLLRRRRRRFRWVRRAGWLAVEWWLVGFMWFVWAVVVIARVFLGVGRGVIGVGRWLLWL